MRLPVRGAVLLFLLFFISTAKAQVPPFGAPFPLANTRYGTTAGSSLLRTDGQNAFLFWTDGAQLRVTRLLPGERHVGRPVLDTPVTSSLDFDVVWTGAHFLVAAVVRDGAGVRLAGRIVEATGHPSGEPFTITGPASSPRMAFNGRNVLLLFSRGEAFAQLLSPDGLPLEEPRKIAGFLVGPAGVASNGNRFAAVLPRGTGGDLLMFDADGRVLSEERLTSFHAQWSIASDGSRFLAVATFAERAEARLIDANGNAGPALQFDAPTAAFYRNADVIWTGSKWAIAYIAGTPREELRIAEVDAAAQSIVSRNAVESWNGAITAVEDRVVVSWAAADAIYSSELPLAPQRIQPVSYAATQQRLLATATSSTATLAVWQDFGDGRGPVRAGVRTRDGRWREQEIAPAGGHAVAASDGREFMVIVGDQVFRLDAEGRQRPFAFTRVTAFRPDGIAWNGRNYAVIGVVDGNLKTALLNADGVVTQSGSIPFDAGEAGFPMIASNGNGFLAAWLHAPPCGPLEEFCVPKGVSGVHLSSTLGVIGTPFVFARNQAIFGAGAAWNGHRYVVAWSTGSRVVAAHVSTSGVQERELSQDAAYSVSVSPLGGAVAVAWRQDDESRISVLNDNGNATAPQTIHRGELISFPPRIATFPDGTIQFIHSAVQNAAPHHGAPHLMMSVGTFALPQRPGAPQLAARRQDGQARLEWSAPAQPVSGYRVEYRVGDGLWNELDLWLDADRRSTSVTLPWEAATYMFRVRAFNDAGAGAYSQTAIINPGRKRVVR